MSAFLSFSCESVLHFLKIASLEKYAFCLTISLTFLLFHRQYRTLGSVINFTMEKGVDNLQSESTESRIEQADKPSSFLDSIRKWAHKRVLVVAALVGVSGASACDMPAEKDNTGLIENENELHKDCAPFAMYFTNALYKSGTSELVGFSLNYAVPEGEEFNGVILKIIDGDEQVIHEEVMNLPSGSARLRFLDSDIPGVSEADVVEMEVDGKIVSRSIDFTSYDDDDPIGI